MDTFYTSYFVKTSDQQVIIDDESLEEYQLDAALSELIQLDDPSDEVLRGLFARVF